MADQGDIATLKGVIETQYITDNTTNDITAERCRQAFDDTIDTLYKEILDIEGSQCFVQNVSNQQTNVDINFESELKICGNKGTFTAKVDFNDRVGTAETTTSALATIPSSQFPDFKWLKPVRYYHVLDNDATGSGAYGAIKFSKLSSYEEGITPDPAEDETVLFINGAKKGVGRFYNFDGVDGLKGGINDNPYDLIENIENTGQINYQTSSPFDLSQGNFQINLMNKDAYLDIIGSTNSIGQQQGTVRIFFEFILL